VPIPFLFGQKKGEFYLTKGGSDWEPYEIPWSDGSTMIVLPLRPVDGVLCLSKYPITNAQYRRFVETTSDGAITEPEGRRFSRSLASGQGKWEGPFYPWKDANFNDPNQPVVCVSYDDALAYCGWVHAELMRGDGPLTSLPNVQLWDFAAFGTDFPPRNPSLWLNRTTIVHHEATSPAAIDRTGERTNIWGLSDMVGNVWEWCRGRTEDDEDTLRYKPEIRGGGFMDNLARTEIFLDASQLPRRRNTRHFDIGFRIATKLVPFDDLPTHLVELLETCKEYKPIFFIGPITP
jgi:formylglycine-generating enzyme required for sulfatase activity